MGENAKREGGSRPDGGGGGGLAEVLRECSASVRGLGYFLSYN